MHLENPLLHQRAMHEQNHTCITQPFGGILKLGSPSMGMTGFNGFRRAPTAHAGLDLLGGQHYHLCLAVCFQASVLQVVSLPVWPSHVSLESIALTIVQYSYLANELVSDCQWTLTDTGSIQVFPTRLQLLQTEPGSLTQSTTRSSHEAL
jgi:hypothetical protein